MKCKLCNYQEIHRFKDGNDFKKFEEEINNSSQFFKIDSKPKDFGISDHEVYEKFQCVKCNSIWYLNAPNRRNWFGFWKEQKNYHKFKIIIYLILSICILAIILIQVYLLFK